MENININELEHNAEELYGLSDMEDILTDENNNSTSSSSITPNDSANFEDEKRITAISIIKNVFHTYLQLNYSTAPTPTTFLTSSEMPQNLYG
ncbi:1180_t:CDS:2, partial [Dentiscutata erythropus]